MEYLLLKHGIAFGASWALAMYLVPMMIQLASRWSILDEPDGRIKVHKKAIPYLGGVAVYLAMVATLAMVMPTDPKILWLLLGSTLLLFVGLVDDMKVLTPLQKFAGQLIVVLGFVKAGFALKSSFFSDWSNMSLSALWMLTVINAFNLVDVMDGLSSTLAIISATSFMILALLTGQTSLSLVLLIFIGALLGFLWYNKPPAQIYLGDAGALFVGGFLAALPLLFSWSEYSLFGYCAPLFMFGVPLLEVVMLVIIRTYLGIPFFRGSPHHFCIYLQNKGWSREQVLAFTLGASTFLGVAGLLLVRGVLDFSQVFFIGVAFLGVWCYVIFS